jgi:hypothetical protein
MNHKVIVGVSLLVVAGLLVGAISAEHRTKFIAKAQARHASYVVYQKQRKQIDQITAERARIVAMCKTNQAFYDTESVAYHKLNPVRPVCNLPEVQ